MIFLKGFSHFIGVVKAFIILRFLENVKQLKTKSLITTNDGRQTMDGFTIF